MDTLRVLDGDAVATLKLLQEPGEADILDEVIRLFAIDAVSCRDAAERALRNHDATSLGLAAHRLHGSAGMLGLRQLQKAAEDLERVANVGGPSEWAARLVRVRDALAAALTAIAAVQRRSLARPYHGARQQARSRR